MVLRFKRLICRVFGHRLIVGTNFWICGRCNYFKPRNGGIVPTDRVTPKAPARPVIHDGPPEGFIDEFHVAFQKAKAAGFAEPDTIIIPRKPDTPALKTRTNDGEPKGTK